MTKSEASSANARLSSGDVSLRPIVATDALWLREAELSEFLAFRWRHHGVHLSPEQYAEAMWTGVLCQFIVVSGDSPVGIVVAYDPDFVGGHCKVGAAKFQPILTTRLVTGVTLLINYLFKGWPFRKLYLEVPEYNLPEIASAVDSLFAVEAVLREHVFLDGIYWPLHVLSTDRARWGEFSARWIGRRAGY